MSRKVLTSAALVWLVLVVGGFAVFYGVAMFSYTRLEMTGNGASARTEKYQWDGEPILIDGKQTRSHFASCEVVPDNGEVRNFSTSHRIQTKKRSRSEPEYVKVGSWFSGSATLTCDEPVSVYAGTGRSMYLLANNRLFWGGVAVVAALPLIAVMVLRSGVIRIQR